MKQVLAIAGALTLGIVRVAAGDSLATGAPTATFNIDQTFVQTAAGQPNQLTDFRWLPDGRLVITVKTGQVYVRPAGGGALVRATGTFAVDSSSEKGLLGVAIHPNFSTTGNLIWYYSAGGTATPPGTDADRHRVVVRTLDAQNQLGATETILVRGLRGPANHDGGAIEVGPDNLLYVGVGDTGCNSNRPPEDLATNLFNYLGTCLSNHATENGGGNGKILRVQLDGQVPPSNPLVNAGDVTACGANMCRMAPTGVGPARADVFAWGFRNPFRIWVDPVTNKVWVGDVGEVSYEEINVVQPGRHHGWPWREGRRGFPVTKCTEIRVGTNAGGTPKMDMDCVDPIYACRHGSGQDTALDPDCTSITGGMIVDSCNWPAPYKGRYFFGDNAGGRLWSLPVNAARDGVGGAREDFGTVSGTPTAIRVGPDGALYYSVLQGNANTPGRIVRISPKTPVACQPGMDGGVIGPTVDGAVGPMVDGAVGPTVDGAVGPTVDGGTTGDGDDSGCGCRAGARGGAPGAPVLGGLLVLGLMLVAARRRRR